MLSVHPSSEEGYWDVESASTNFSKLGVLKKEKEIILAVTSWCVLSEKKM